MRWIVLICLCMVLSTSAEPEPKKYKPQIKPKVKETNSSLTDEERKFLREVEAKFGLKPDVPTEVVTDENNESDNNKPTDSGKVQSFPAVIAIEIVNDTEKNTKGKRTIDANLGYGYRTNNGYTYTYFGKPAQEQGKFMIYPYSQHDIPPANANDYQQNTVRKYTTTTPNVEIQPSQAYELVSVKDEQSSYNAKGSSHSQGYSTPSTLYSTYNGQKFSGLSSQFPSVMSNYFVEPSQLLKNPQYQGTGLTQDHLSPHGPHLQQRVVPVLVLRIPSSYLKNPTAELYANLPKNYPHSQQLNSVNLQDLVNQYFRKIGYNSAPKLMINQNSLVSAPISAPPKYEAPSPSSAPIASHEPNHYANPYVQPSYTQADYSGIQYSAVQPVMAKYPSNIYSPYSTAHLYQQPQQQYQYQYVTQTSQQPQTYYMPAVHYQPQVQYQAQPEYQQQVQYDTTSSVQGSVPETSAEYVVPQQPEAPVASAQDYEKSANPNTVQYGSQQQYETEQEHAPQYEVPKEETSAYSPSQAPAAEYGSTKVSIPADPSPQVQYQYESPNDQSYYYSKQSVPKETIAYFPSARTMQKTIVNPATGGTQSYYYQKQTNDDSASDSLVISENYPSKSHTIATVLPASYASAKKPSTVQAVSYVTPIPHLSKYQSQYQVMVPQTILKNPANEKVSYVNSHSLPSTYPVASNQEYNPEEEYTVSTQYVPPIGKQKAPSYPRNYHTHPKRMVKPENKAISGSSPRKQEKNENKKSSSS